MSKPIRIYSTNEVFVFKSISSLISFNKQTKLYKSLELTQFEAPSTYYDVYSVVGLIEANNNSYLIAVSNVKEIGCVLNSKIYKIEAFTYIPSQNYKITEADKSYLKMLDDFLARNPLYYSDTMDLTISFKSYKKRIENNSYTFKSFLFPYSIPFYCWNYSIATIFDYKGMERFIFPIINGYVGISSLTDYAQGLKYVLIARKDTRRSGMRFLIRGADVNGNVANFVETEEILYLNEGDKIDILSFVQIKGSVPLIWNQEPCLQLNPPIIPKDDFQVNTKVFDLHMNDLIKSYDGVYAINLIDKKKDQKTLGDYYHTLYMNYKEEKKISNIMYVWFDFHSECKKMKYQNLSKLMKSSSVIQAINNMKYTHVQFNANILKMTPMERTIDLLPSVPSNDVSFLSTQTGVFRSNCVDCLDRTNVVQTLFGRYFLHKMLFALKKCPAPNGEAFQKFNDSFEKLFKIMWADHGDNLSLAYSGTGALKSDYVRTGKRSFMGNLVDGYLSCKRFYINNFVDGYNQDCHDYFLGILVPKKNQFKQHSTGTLTFLIPLVILISYFIYYLLVSIALPKNYEINVGRCCFKGLIFLGAVALTTMVIFGNLKNSIIDTHSRHA